MDVDPCASRFCPRIHSMNQLGSESFRVAASEIVGIHLYDNFSCPVWGKDCNVSKNR